jgi:hypothetical protein
VHATAALPPEADLCWGGSLEQTPSCVDFRKWDESLIVPLSSTHRSIVR